MKVFIDGLLTGLLLQTAIGPVFFFITNIVLQGTIYDGFAAVMAVTLVDYIYIVLAVLGIGKLLKKKKVEKIFRLFSAIILIMVGAFILKEAFNQTKIATVSFSPNVYQSFLSVFLLTIVNPMTVILFAGIFSTKVIEKKYSEKQLWVFGMAVGLATFLFMGISVTLLSFTGKILPISIIRSLNFLVGFLIILYGLIISIKLLFNKALGQKKFIL